MQELFEIFDIKLRSVQMRFKRFLFHEIDWNNRMIAIQGARGSGKTTLLLQHIKSKFSRTGNSVLYVDVNHFYFTQNTLIDLADSFYKQGGSYLFLDEIHKYQNWSIELKQIYDTYHELQIIFTGSSILELQKGEADLSRRMISYFLPGLSFREYLEFNHQLKYEKLSLESLRENHWGFSQEINGDIRPLELFKNYLKQGYYPYFKENISSYNEKLINTINLIIEVDLPAVERIDFSNIQKIKKLLSIISQSVPFKPNTKKLAEMISVSRPTLIRFFQMLHKAQLISLLQSSTKGVQKMAKPDKIYLNNSNLMYALGGDLSNIGNIRESFFYSQVSVKHQLSLPKSGDFLVDSKYTFEVGGKNKTSKQIEGIENAYIVKDDIETGYNHIIPLWLFGFLY